MIMRAWRFLAAALAVLLILPAGAASVARSKGDRVNVRSRPGFSGEVITQLEQGQQVVVLSTNVLSQPAAGEPPVWYMIELPERSPVWVSADYVEPESRRVTADILNVRAGPGIAYAAVGRVPHGTQLEFLEGRRDGWIEVASPPGAIGYVPEAWITFDGQPAAIARGGDGPASPDSGAPTNIAAATPPGHQPGASPASPGPAVASSAPPPQPGEVRYATRMDIPAAALESPLLNSRRDYDWFQQFVRTNPSPAFESAHPVVQETFIDENAPGSGRYPAIAPVIDLDEGGAPVGTGGSELPGTGLESTTSPEPGPFGASESEEDRVPGPPAGIEESSARRVRREGLVIRPFNFAAPSFYGLESLDTGKTINFLFTSRSEPISWREYRGRVVIVTGREYLDRRTYWRGVPLLDVEEIVAVR